MSGINNLPGYTNINTEELLEALGNTKFSGTASEKWVHVINGLIIQGGITDTHGGPEQVISFNAAFTKQVLGVFICPTGGPYYNFFVKNITLEQFTFGKSTASTTVAYWFAVGV